ncbi:hypothetical protein O181_002305 [Austropuccinia psidii MF-1]|uniref:Integrase catalytic domain-containing protein n=1 Tax=Austropuccinia psidii MF-1 TaxID=1389203 RepID=A0A9Q3BC70_9BASI|nr:hypothetical protein [Austropuccinia psidii MF-1]
MQTLSCVKGLYNVPFNHDINLCKTCSLAKSQHSPFHPESRNLVTWPGDVVVADLMRPFPPSFDKKVYGMIIQDHFSSLGPFYALKSKSEAPQFLMNWIAQFTNLTPHLVKRLWTDNAGEFLSKSLNLFLEQRGIIHKTIFPYEHHQAGKIEWTNRTVAEVARSMLLKRNLGTTLWPYAFRHAFWVFNRVLHAGNDRAPYKLMTGRKPDLTPLQVFGCRAASALFDETPWDPKEEVNTIEVQSMLDPTLVEEMNGQDESVEFLSSEASNNSEAPNNYKKAMAAEAKN